MESKEKLSSAHYHEVLDRIYVIMNNIDSHLIEHPVSKKHKKITQSLCKAIDHLYSAYQQCGSYIHKESNKKTQQSS